MATASTSAHSHVHPLGKSTWISLAASFAWSSGRASQGLPHRILCAVQRTQALGSSVQPPAYVGEAIHWDTCATNTGPAPRWRRCDPPSQKASASFRSKAAFLFAPTSAATTGESANKPRKVRSVNAWNAKHRGGRAQPTSRCFLPRRWGIMTTRATKALCWCQSNLSIAHFSARNTVDCEMQPPLRQGTGACRQSIIDGSNSTIQKTLTFSKLKLERNFDGENSCPTAMKTRVQNWESIHIHTPKNLLCAPVWSGLPVPAWRAAFLERQPSLLCFAVILI